MKLPASQSEANKDKPRKLRHNESAACAESVGEVYAPGVECGGGDSDEQPTRRGELPPPPLLLQNRPQSRAAGIFSLLPFILLICITDIDLTTSYHVFRHFANANDDPEQMNPESIDYKPKNRCGL